MVGLVCVNESRDTASYSAPAPRECHLAKDFDRAQHFSATGRSAGIIDFCSVARRRENARGCGDYDHSGRSRLAAGTRR